MNHQQTRQKAFRWIVDIVGMVRCIGREDLAEMIQKQWKVGNETALAYIHDLCKERRIEVDFGGIVSIPETEPESADHGIGTVQGATKA